MNFQLYLFICFFFIWNCDGWRFQRPLFAKEVITPKSFITSFKKLSIATICVAASLSFNLDGVLADSKADKLFENCLSKCVFNETRPPPLGSTAERLEIQRQRGDIIRDCRKECAKTPEQLLTGSPKKKKTTESTITNPTDSSTTSTSSSSQ